MAVFIIVGTIFTELLLAVLAVTAVFLLLRQYVTRQERSLAWFAACFAMLATAGMCLYAGHVLLAYGYVDATVFAHRAAAMLAALTGGCATVGFAVLMRLPMKAGHAVASFLLTTLGVLVACGSARMMVVSYGMGYLAFDGKEVAACLSPLLYAAALMIAVSASRRLADLRAARRTLPADRIFVNAGLCCVLFVVIAGLSSVLALPPLVSAAFAFLCAAAVLLFLGAVTATHPDPDVRVRPQTFFTRSLVLKSVGINAMVFWLLALALVAVTSSYHVTNTVQLRESGLRRDVHYFSRAASSHRFALLEETARFAASEKLVRSLAASSTQGEAPVSEAVREFMERRAGSRILRVIDADGIIVFSTHSPDERGQRMLPSRVLDRALAGSKLAAVEREDAFGIWTVRAGVPVFRADGTTAGVLLDTAVETAFDFSDYAAISPIQSAGYGFVSEKGDLVYSTGTPADALTRMELLRTASVNAIARVRLGEATYFVERAADTDGRTDGFFYVSITDAMRDAEAFRGIAAVTCIAVLAVLLMTVVLLLCLTVVLSPIRRLRDASARVERESYGTRVDYRSADELGQLANAFNRMQGKIAERTEALRDALREKQDFLDNTVRDLRSPLSIFRWTLEMMRFGETGALTKEQQELLEQLHQTNERLMRMVQNLQDTTAVDYRKLTLKLENVQMEDLLDEAAGSVAVACRKKGIALHWNRPRTPLPPVRADAQSVRKVLANVVGNAVRFTPQDGHVQIGAAVDGKFLRVTVEDNGIGIPKEDLGSVFNRFFRARNAAGIEADGAGLGLYLAKTVVELHGGTMTIESEEGGGTTADFTLPLAPQERKAAARRNIPNASL